MSGKTGTLARVIRLAGLVEAPTPERPYRCRGCEASFDVQYHVCPECGGFSVEPTAEDDI